MKNHNIYNKLIVSFLMVICCFMSFFNTGCSEEVDSPDPIIGPPIYTPGDKWTIMIYGDGDNNLEEFLLSDIEEMKDGYVNNQGLNLIVLADRIQTFTSSTFGFGEDFSDTRLYRITSGAATRIGGGTQFPEITTTSDYEANMADAAILKKFIQFCKANYPANHYALVLWNHGLGPRKKGGSSTATVELHHKGVCADDTSYGDYLYTAEISDLLTANESVDLLGFDACLMGSVEIAYQYRPGNGGFSADVMVASPPVEWGYGWKYDNILERLNTDGGDNGEYSDVVGTGRELNYDPATMTAADLGRIIVEEQYDSTNGLSGTDSLSCYDLSKVAAVKTAVDELAFQLDDASNQIEFETVRDATIHYFNEASDEEWVLYPFFDLYDLCERTDAGNGFNPTVVGLAGTVMTAVDDMVLYSYAGSDFSDFVKGENGLYIFFPDGDTEYDSKKTHWYYQWWYNAISINPDYNPGYGKLDWCIDGAIEGNSNVENWFEMLDKWFEYDSGDDTTWPSEWNNVFPTGGANGYDW